MTETERGIGVACRKRCADDSPRRWSEQERIGFSRDRLAVDDTGHARAHGAEVRGHVRSTHDPSGRTRTLRLSTLIVQFSSNCCAKALRAEERDSTASAMAHTPESFWVA